MGAEQGTAIITRYQRLSAAGFAATAISFGPARMGFGLFAPEFRSAFSLSTSAIGLVSSLGFLAFFLGLLIAQAQLTRCGPGRPVLVGLAAAAAGMGIITLAPNLPVLAAGVFIAASSAGLTWTPFNDAVHRNVPGEKRASALSVISTGTGVGITLAGVAVLAMVFAGLSWRLCWALFTAAGVAALLGNLLAFRAIGRDPRRQPTQEPAATWKHLADAAIVPLLGIGFAYGTTSAIYIAFAADHVVAAGGVPGVPVKATPALIYICYGVFGLAGLMTARVRDVIGLQLLVRVLMLGSALSVALIAIAPGSWAGLILSAGLQGVFVMMTSAVLAFWSGQLFPSRPSLGFTATLLAAAGGSVLGPAVAGMVSSATGATAMFLGTSALPVVAAVLLRARHARDRPAGTGQAGHA